MRENRESICSVSVFACVVSIIRKTPKLSPMADNAISRGGGISGVYLWITHKSQRTMKFFSHASM